MTIQESEQRFRATLEQRSAELRSGAVQGIPLEEALTLIATPLDRILPGGAP